MQNELADMNINNINILIEFIYIMDIIAPYRYFSESNSENRYLIAIKIILLVSAILNFFFDTDNNNIPQKFSKI